MPKKVTKLVLKDITDNDPDVASIDRFKLFKKINEAFENGEEVLLSLEGIERLTSAFVLTVARLSEIYGPNKIKRDLKYEGAGPHRLAFIEGIIKIGAEHF